jgi:PAS domain S-box-containing protein
MPDSDFAYTGLATGPPLDEPTAQPARLFDAAAILIRDVRDQISFRTVLDALPVAVYTTDAEGRITYFNRAAAELAGREPQLGIDEWCVSWRLFRADGAPLPHDQCPMAIALSENRAVRGVEAILERPDGTRVPFVPYPTPLRDATGALTGAVNLLVDISDRKAAEGVRAYLAAIVESSDDAIISKDLNGIVTSWNRGAEAIFGFRADEIIGWPIRVLLPPDRMGEEDLILERMRGGDKVDHFETVRRHKDGHHINVSLTISPVRDENGRITGISKIARDITERTRTEAALRDLNDNLERRVAERTRELAEANERLLTEIAERERTEAVLQQAQKMEAVGQLASGIAHDFNNLLSAVLCNLELLEMRLKDERLLRLAQAATRAARRGATLNEQMLAFSRKQHLAPKAVDVNDLLIRMDDLLRSTLGGTVHAATAISNGLWPALVDPHQLELVILNLMINARDAMPQGGRVLIESRNLSAPDGDPSIDLAPGDYVVISVADAGTGMTPKVLARACEPFFTTKELGKGTGLGLAQVYGVARQSGGSLRIASVEGEGTTVEIFLPRSRDAAGPVSEPIDTRPAGLEHRRARVLVVDDHDEVREVIAAHLDALGYRSVSAASGSAAIELLSSKTAPIDLLLTDFAMPDMSGVELARAVRAKRPGLPVVMVTGYVDTGDLDQRIDNAILMRKPFRMSELGDTLDRALRSPAPVRRVSRRRRSPT